MKIIIINMRERCYKKIGEETRAGKDIREG